MRIERIELTPKMAEYFLSKNFDDQRKINWHWVQTISNDIKEGNWNPNVPNSAIVFSKRGAMLDGQHRCLAIANAGIPVRTYAIYDVDEDSFKDIDNGISRTARDFIKCKNNITVSSVATLAVCIEEGAGLYNACHSTIKQSEIKGHKSNLKPSREQTLSYYEQNTDYLERLVSYAISVYTSSKLASKSTIAKAMWIIDYVEGSSSLATLFFDDVKADMQTTLATGRLVKKLMNMAIETKTKHVSFGQHDYITLILAAYDKFKEGKNFTNADVKKASNIWNNKIAIARMNKEKAETEVKTNGN